MCHCNGKIRLGATIAGFVLRRNSYGRGDDASMEVVIISAGLAVAVVAIFVWVVGDDGGSEEEMRRKHAYNQQPQEQRGQASRERVHAPAVREQNPALSRFKVGESLDSTTPVRKRASAYNAATEDDETD